MLLCTITVDAASGTVDCAMEDSLLSGSHRNYGGASGGGLVRHSARWLWLSTQLLHHPYGRQNNNKAMHVGQACQWNSA